MKKIISLFIAIALLSFVSVNVQGQTKLQEYRDSFEQHMFDIPFLQHYANALKKAAKTNRQEYMRISNNLASITAFACFQKLTGVGKMNIPAKGTEYKEVLKAMYPLTPLHKYQLQFIDAAYRKNYAGMRRFLAQTLQQPMPKDNMTDVISVGNMLSYLVDCGTVDQARSYKKFLENYMKTAKSEDMKSAVHSALNDVTGFIMLKEWEAKHPEK